MSGPGVTRHGARRRSAAPRAQVWQYVMSLVNDTVLEGLSQCLAIGGQGSRMLQSLSGSTKRGLTLSGCHRLVADMNALHKGLALATPQGVSTSTDGLLTVIDWATQARPSPPRMALARRPLQRGLRAYLWHMLPTHYLHVAMLLAFIALQCGPGNQLGTQVDSCCLQTQDVWVCVHACAAL